MWNLLTEMGFLWDKGPTFALLCTAIDDPLEGDGEVLIFRDGCNGERFCQHYAGQKLDPFHEFEGENLEVHLQSTQYSLLASAIEIWGVNDERANNHERFLYQCKAAIKGFQTQQLGAKRTVHL